MRLYRRPSLRCSGGRNAIKKRESSAAARTGLPEEPAAAFKKRAAKIESGPSNRHIAQMRRPKWQPA